MGYLFRNCNNIKTIDVSSFDTTSVTSMLAMFYGCSSLTSLNLSNYDTSNVKSMNTMFMAATKINQKQLYKYLKEINAQSDISPFKRK